MKCIQTIMDYIIIVKVRVFNVCIRIFHVALEYLTPSYCLMHATPHLSLPPMCHAPCSYVTQMVHIALGSSVGLRR